MNERKPITMTIRDAIPGVALAGVVVFIVGWMMAMPSVEEARAKADVSSRAALEAISAMCESGDLPATGEVCVEAQALLEARRPASEVVR